MMMLSGEHGPVSAGLTLVQLFGLGTLRGQWYGHGRNRSSIDFAARRFAGPTRCWPAYNLLTDPNAANYKLPDLVEPSLDESSALFIGCLYDWWTSPLDLHFIG
jgi:hypothetical protein